MKKTISYLLLVLTVLSCNVSKELSQSGEEEKKFVASFLDQMVVRNQEKMIEAISPKYLKSDPDLQEKVLVNNYSIKNYRVEDTYKVEKGTITALIWGDDEYGWMHRLTFKLVKEKGKLYIWPTKNKEYPKEYVNPWTVAVTNVNR